MTTSSLPTVFVLGKTRSSSASPFYLNQELANLGISCWLTSTKSLPKYRPERVQHVINYGVSQLPSWASRLPSGVRFINTPEAVELSSNKLEAQRAFIQEGVPCLEHTTDRAEAQRWLDAGEWVVSRTLTRASKAKGLVLSPPDSLPNAPLYTKFFGGKGTREYRVYVVGGAAIDLTEKRRYTPERREEEGIEHTPYTKHIRTNDNGWVFARTTMQASIEHQRAIKELAERAANAINMLLGGVDILVKYDKRGRILDSRVIETNTAISLTGDRTTRRTVATALAVYLNE